MNEPLPKFPYFDDPVAALSFEQLEEPCACCGRVRGVGVAGAGGVGLVYTGSIYGERSDDPRVCPWCVADGSASRAWKEGAFNTLADRSVPTEVREAVEKRTPGFTTWQDLEWPVCCNDACVFRGYAQHEQLTRTWPEAGKSLLATYEEGWLGTQTAEQFIELFKNECDPGGYAFQCRHCAKWRVEWDCS